jgi:amidase
VPGPLARTVRDAALLFEVLADRSGALAACVPGAAAGLRVGIADGWLSGDPATDALCAAAVALLEASVATVREVIAPAAPPEVEADQLTVLVAELHDDLAAYLGTRPGTGVRSVADVVAFNAEHAAHELAAFDQDLFEMAMASGGRAGAAYAGARDRNLAWARDACLGPALASGVDVLVAPAYRPAWKSDLVHGDQISGGGDVTTPPAILGWPILTVPVGLVDGLPVGLALVGPAGSEERLLAVGYALEQALGLGAPTPTWRAAQRG